MGRTEADRKITDEPWSSIERGTNKTTLRSERRSTLKKRLTEPTLLEMSGNPTTRVLEVRGIAIRSSLDTPD
jgi:hypothetical protein